jgi:hypothetical protein
LSPVFVTIIGWLHYDSEPNQFIQVSICSEEKFNFKLLKQALEAFQGGPCRSIKKTAEPTGSLLDREFAWMLTEYYRTWGQGEVMSF